MEKFVGITNVGFTPLVEIAEPGSTRHNGAGKLVFAKTIIMTIDEARIVYQQLGEILKND